MKDTNEQHSKFMRTSSRRIGQAQKRIIDLYKGREDFDKDHVDAYAERFVAVRRW